MRLFTSFLLLFCLSSVSADSGSASVAPKAQVKVQVEVWKTPTCGCCKAWVSYLEDRGFEVKAHDLTDVSPIKEKLGLTDRRLHSCHTAKVGNYVIEGHVPADDIHRLLKEQPEIVGLTAPGMPMMSPGMNSIEPKGYDIIAFDKDQKPSIYSRY